MTDKRINDLSSFNMFFNDKNAFLKSGFQVFLLYLYHKEKVMKNRIISPINVLFLLISLNNERNSNNPTFSAKKLKPKYRKPTESFFGVTMLVIKYELKNTNKNDNIKRFKILNLP